MYAIIVLRHQNFRMRYIFTAIIILSISAIYAQNGNLAGKVKTVDRQPAAWVNIMLKGTRKGVVTDNNGRYHIRNIQPGTYTILVSFTGLQSQERTVDISNGTTATADFTLSEDSKELEEVIVATTPNRYIEKRPSPSLRLQTDLLVVFHFPI